MRLVVAVALLVVFAAAPTMAIRTDYAAVLVGNFTTRVLPVENRTHAEQSSQATRQTTQHTTTRHRGRGRQLTRDTHQRR